MIYVNKTGSASHRILICIFETFACILCMARRFLCMKVNRHCQIISKISTVPKLGNKKARACLNTALVKNV